MWLALRARVSSLSLSPALPVAWPDLTFEKPAGGYLRVTWLPNTAQRLFVGSADPSQRPGLLQLDVFQPLLQNVALCPGRRRQGRLALPGRS